MSAAAEVATEVVETVADAAEETIVALDMVNNLNGTTRKQQIIVLVAVGVVAAGAGAVISHYVTKKVMRTKFEMMMEEELDKTREFFANRETVTIDNDEPILDPEDMLRMAADLGAQKVTQGDNEFVTQGAPDPVLLKAGDDETAEVVRRNAFAEKEAEPVVDIARWTEDNIEAMNEDRPYVIDKEDFFENDGDTTQITYTYFEGDGVLADEREQVIPDVEAAIGVANLARFGWQSQDDNTVYVRVPKHHIEVEVIRSEGTYAAEVHGFTHEDDTFEKRRRGGKVRYGEE